MLEHDGLAVSWLGHATIRVADRDTVVYLDPGPYEVLDEWTGTRTGEVPDADVVCVSHGHHYDPDAIGTVATETTELLVFEGIDTHRIDRDVERPADLPYETRMVGAASDLAVDDTIVRTTAAYNEPDGPHVRADGEPYHPPGRGCGFLLTLSGTTVYWPGDTDVLPGHRHLDVDVFCPPIGGTVTMDRHGAADLAEALDPGLVLPVHYDTVGAIEADVDAFAADLGSRGVPVALDR